MKSAVFFDIDGTLWDYKHNVPESAEKAIRQLRKNGSLAFICSGRTRCTMNYPELMEIGFDGIIGGCGTYIEKDGKVLYSRRIPLDDIRSVSRAAEECNIALMYEGQYELFVDTVRFAKDPFVQQFKKDLGKGFKSKDDIDESSLINKFCADYRNGDGKKFMSLLGRKFDFILHSYGPVMEVIPAGAGKGKGIIKACELLDIDLKNTYAFGDSENDISMLETAGTGIAMGNGTDKAKEAADYVTSGLFEDGISNALRHFGVI